MLELVTLEAPAGNVVTLHDIALLGGGGAGAALVSADGLIGIPAVRESRRDAVERHGIVDSSKFVGGRGPSLVGELWGATHTAAYARYDDLVRALWATLDAPGVLRYRRSDAAVTLRSLVKLVDVSCPLAGAAKLLTYQLALSQPEPRAYSDTIDLVVGAAPTVGGGGLMFPFMFPLAFSSSGGGTAVVTNDGTAPAALLIRVYGYAVSPRVRVLETGEEIVFTGEVSTGTYFEIDTTGPTIRLNGDASRMDQLDASASTFFEIPANTSLTLQLLATDWDAGAHLEIETRDAFGG